ncbi:TPA: protein-export chaperone SecB [Bacillus pseudomycoides]|nr:protein-export chaperone SecB [Bacillus pseudomycoides]
MNAITILYSYLRSVVSEITSKGTSSSIILPTMNIAAMFNQYNRSSSTLFSV